MGFDASQHPVDKAEHNEREDVASPAFMEPDESAIVTAAVEHAEDRVPQNIGEETQYDDCCHEGAAASARLP